MSLTELKLSAPVDTDGHHQNPSVEASKFRLLHEVFRHRAADPVQVPLMAFPKSKFSDFELFTAQDLDRFVDTAAWHYSQANLQTVRSTKEKR